MPITIRPSPQPALKSLSWTPPITGSADLLQQSCPREHPKVSKILASTFSDDPQQPPRVGCRNGFVYAALGAYYGHHHLVLRPEDIWFAILAQLSVNINRNAESLRSIFVDHQGQKQLSVLIAPGDYGAGAEQLTHAIQENIKTPDLREWMMPAFTTTTQTDTEVASVIMMGAMQKYFKYHMEEICGLPYVTLLGERKDWALILSRIERLPSFGDEARLWYLHLKPAIQGFVKTFDLGDEVSDFWMRMATHHPARMCGVSDTVSGWLTAFGFWNNDGVQQLRCSEEAVQNRHFERYQENRTHHITTILLK